MKHFGTREILLLFDKNLFKTAILLYILIKVYVADYYVYEFNI